MAVIYLSGGFRIVPKDNNARKGQIVVRTFTQGRRSDYCPETIRRKSPSIFKLSRQIS